MPRIDGRIGRNIRASGSLILSIALAATVAIAGATSPASASPQDVELVQDVDSSRVLVFDETVSLATAKKALIDSDVSEVVAEFEGPDGTITVGVVLDDSATFDSTMNGQIEALMQDLKDTGIETPLEAPSLTEMRLVRADVPAEASIQKLQILGGVEEAEATAVLPTDTKLATELSTTLDAGGITTMAAGACDNSKNFLPAVSYLSTIQDGDGARTIRSNFKWNTTNLKNLQDCSSVTYEHDFVEYNYDKKHYLGSILSWASNLPGAYKDTNFLDSPKENVYTVGCSRGAELVANKTYAISIRNGKGNATSGKGKLQGQRGVRLPASCFSTWCIFARNTLDIYKAWTVPIPGTK